MTRLSRPDRVWMICGSLVAVVLVIGGWFLAIGPGYAERDGLRAQAATAGTQRSTLNRKIADLERQRDNLDEYQATLAQDRQALPQTPELSDFLRQLQAAGTETGVAVSGLLVGTATKIPNSTASLFALPITMTAAGSVDGLGQFLDQVQRVRPRAVLISGVNAVPAGKSSTLAESATMTLSLRVFVAATANPASAASPSP